MGYELTLLCFAVPAALFTGLASFYVGGFLRRRSIVVPLFIATALAIPSTFLAYLASWNWAERDIMEGHDPAEVERAHLLSLIVDFPMDVASWTFPISVLAGYLAVGLGPAK